MQIKESDERNVVISNLAKAAGFDVIIYLFSITILAMALLGYLTKGIFFYFYRYIFNCSNIFCNEVMVFTNENVIVSK